MNKLSRLLVVAAVPFLPIAALAQGLQVVDAKLGKNVQDRAITEEATTFAVNEKVYLWLKLTGSAPDAVKVNWKTGDRTETVTLKVGGSPWRTWSSRIASKAGDWTVTVTDSSDQVLKEMKFTVQ